MSGVRFIAGKLRFKGRLAAIATAVSFAVIIIAVGVSSGFRQEIRSALSETAGDVILCSSSMDMFSDTTPLPAEPSWLEEVRKIEGVREIRPVVWRAGIVRQGEDIHGVLFKGVECSDSSLTARIPASLARKTGLGEGDRMSAWFIGEKVKARSFRITQVYESAVETDGRMTIYVPIGDLRRLAGWDEDQVSALEVILDPSVSKREMIRYTASEIGSYALMSSHEDEPIFIASSLPERYPQLFDWLDLIDLNVTAILVLMIIVAGFGMISGLLILLFRNIGTIGTLKALGMKDSGIAGVFLRLSAGLVLKGMLIGNAAGLALCLVQKYTHLMKLDPSNYFVSFVPVNIDVPWVLMYDAIAFAAIMLLLLIPSLFISRVDPSETMKVR